MMRPLDRLLLAIVRRRLSRCRCPGDCGDVLADQLAGLICAEIGRRRATLKDWDAKVAAARGAAEFNEFRADQARLQ